MSKLYLVPTPIGNLEDMTFRAVRILREAGLILAEDTRTSSKLLRHYEIENKVQSYHQYNEHSVAGKYADRIAEGEIIALITDAGTPAISDPGFLLVRECLIRGVSVECLPGATAFVPALAVSGLAADSFTFEGFLPHKKGRNKKIKQVISNPHTTIIYESPFRLKKALEQIIEQAGPERRLSVSREISKMYEETIRGHAEEVLEFFTRYEPKGEFVIVLEGTEELDKRLRHEKEKSK